MSVEVLIKNFIRQGREYTPGTVLLLQIELLKLIEHRWKSVRNSKTIQTNNECNWWLSQYCKINPNRYWSHHVNGVEVKATNISTNQIINGTVNSQTKEATFSNLGVASDKLNEKYNLEVKWGKAGYEHTEKLTITVDNRAASVWTTISDVSLTQGQSKIINLKEYITKFGEQTLF